MRTTPLYLAVSHLLCLLTRNRKPLLQRWDEALLDIPEEQWSVFDSDGFVLYTGTLDDCLYVQDHSHGGLTVMPVNEIITLERDSS